MNIDGFTSGNGAYNIRQRLPNGISVRLGYNSYNELVYEAQVPFATFYKASLSPSDAGKAVSVGIFVHALKKPDTHNDGGSMPGNASMGGGGGNGRMGGGGMGGGGRHGGGASSTNSETESIFEPTKTWKQASLAWR